MKQLKLWMCAAILSFCGANMLTSCTETDDPVRPEPESVQRLEFQKQLSADLNEVTQYVNLDPTLKAIQILTSFTNNLDPNALGEQAMDIINQILSNMYAEQPTCQLLYFADLGELRDEAVNACQQQLGIENPELFMLINAYNSIGTRHMIFKQGSPVAEIVEDDALVLEYQDTDLGETTELRLEFSDADDGVILFATKLLGSPLAIQLPETIGITITTGKTGEPKEVLTGSVKLTSPTAKYVSFKGSDWVAEANLEASVVGRKEDISLALSHTAEGEMNLTSNLTINDHSLLTISAFGVRDPYSKEEMEQLKELRNMGAFYSAAYDVLKAFNGRSIDDLVLTVNDNVSIDVNVNDVAKGLVALGNLHQLHEEKGSKDVVDVYTQMLNDVMKFSVAQKNTGIMAEGSLITIMKEGEYQPAVALRFEGETKFQAVYDNLTEQDKANYKALLDSFKEPIATFSALLKAFQVKGKELKSAIGF